MDPAVTSRTDNSIIVVDDAALPERNMTIPGIEGRLPARILSTDLKGSSTRLVRLVEGWGSGLPGSFDAHVELFVIRGNVSIGDYEVGDQEYIGIWQDGVVPGIRVTGPGVGLLMTSAPVRYDASAGGATARIVTGRHVGEAWEPLPNMPGRFVRRMARGPVGDVWVGGAVEWSPAGAAWLRHPHDEECLVLDGEMIITDFTDGTVIATEADKGTYFYRPAGSLHCGPGSKCADTAITFHRASGEAGTDWVEAVNDVVPGDPEVSPDDDP